MPSAAPMGRMSSFVPGLMSATSIEARKMSATIWSRFSDSTSARKMPRSLAMVGSMAIAAEKSSFVQPERPPDAPLAIFLRDLEISTPSKGGIVFRSMLLARGVDFAGNLLCVMRASSGSLRSAIFAGASACAALRSSPWWASVCALLSARSSSSSWSLSLRWPCLSRVVVGGVGRWNTRNFRIFGTKRVGIVSLRSLLLSFLSCCSCCGTQ